MNKKIITLIISIIIIAGIAGGILFLNKNKATQENDSSKQNETTNNNGENNSNKNEENINKEGKVLVLYFSMSGNTETVAKYIHEEVGGDILEIETVQTYPSDYNTLLNFAQEEQRKNARPELKTKINLDDYDTIFLGSPNWWGDLPMPIYTVLDEYDFSNKTIAQFMTHGGSGLSGTTNKIKKEEPNATITEGLAVRDSNAKDSKSAIQEWLKKIGY